MTSFTMMISVDTCDTKRLNSVVTASLPLNLNGIAGLRLEEVNSHGQTLDADVPFQLDAENQESYTLRFIMTGETPAGLQRLYFLYLDEEARSFKHPASLVRLSEIYHQGQESYLIETPAATLIFHKYGGGFASLFDQDGHDWISYRPQGGSDGAYRGIPNIKHPDDYFHPGFRIGKSQVLSAGPVCCRIHTETNDGVCEAIWDIYPDHMRFHVLKAPQPYWLLYEGTPAGGLDENEGFIVRSDGTRTSLGESWDAVLNPGWLYFGASTADHVLFFAQHTTEPKLSSYFPMEGNMTVFGFGRKDLEHYLTQVPATYTIGLIASQNFEEVSGQIASICDDLIVEIKQQEAS